MNKINKGIESEGNKESPLNINQKKIQNEMIHLKDDILKDLKNFEQNYSEKFKSSNKLIDEKLEEYERKIEIYNQRLFKISQLVVEDKSLKEKIEKISQDRMEIKDQILTIGVKLNKLEKQYNDKIEEIDNILNDSVKYQGIIGSRARFINFHEFIDYVLSQIAKMTTTSQKNSLEIISFKNRFETNFKNIKMQIEDVNKSANQFTKKSVNDSENKLKDMIKIYENNLEEIKEENENYMKKLEQLNNDLKKEMKNDIESEKIKNKEDNDKIAKLISDFENQVNNLKDSYNKFNEDLIEINKRIDINEEAQKKENKKDELNDKDDNNKDNSNLNYYVNNNNIINNKLDENEIMNKYFKGEISENQFFIYTEFIKLNNLFKNILSEFLEKSSEDKKLKHLIKHKNNSGENNLVKKLSSCFNNILSEISMERPKRKTVNNLLRCINLKLTYKKKDEKEQNNNMSMMRKNSSTLDFRKYDLNNELKIKTSENNNYMINDLGYKTFQMNNRKYKFNLINSEDSKKTINENSKIIEGNIKNEEEDMNEKKKDLRNLFDSNNLNEININKEKNNIIIDCEKNKNEELKIKEYNNKISYFIKEKTNINRTNSIKKELINNILQSQIENEKENISRRKIIKENIIYKIKNNIKKVEESKQSKILNNTLPLKREIDNTIEPNTINVTTNKIFKGKKYFGYEKSFDAKVKGKLISYDINYKEKMKNNFYNDLCFSPNGNIMLPKTKKRMEAENIQKMINNLQSYIGENSFNKKYYLQRNNMNYMSQSTTKLRDNLFSKNLFG